MFEIVRNLFNNQPPSDKKYFIITSHGQTATLWLAAALNKHPKIFCTHAYQYPPTGAEDRDLTTDEHIKRANDTNGRFWTLRLNDYLIELAQATDKPLVGNVHAFTYGRLRKMLPKLKYPIRKNLTIINMIRHPISRLQSTYMCWTADRDDKQPPEFIDYDFEKRAKHITSYLSHKHKIDFSPKNKSFIVALLSIEDITRDIQLAKKYKIPHLVFENLTNNSDHLNKLINTLCTHDQSILDQNKMIEILSTKRINQHNQRSETFNDQIYLSWSAWKQDAFKYIFNSLKMADIYAGFEYDFAFIK